MSTPGAHRRVTRPFHPGILAISGWRALTAVSAKTLDSAQADPDDDGVTLSATPGHRMAFVHWTWRDR